MLRMRESSSPAVSLVSGRRVSGPELVVAPTDERETVTLLDAVLETAVYVQSSAEASIKAYVAQCRDLDRMAGEMVERCRTRSGTKR